MELLLLLFFVALPAVCIDGTLSSPVVRTKTGQVRGKLVQLEGAKQDVYEFIGIPYAEPPIGQLRFKQPKPKSPWTGIFEATRLAKSCIQFDSGTEIKWAPKKTQQSEDCLIVNIWVPRTALDLSRTSSLLPVYVFIHGGGYIGGTTMEYFYNGTVMSGYDNIIVATLQYRLGALGFAYFGSQNNNEAPGNVGLWDQLEALKWISENIGAFGGNNQQITIGGESAGASSVTYHLMSPYSRPYFQRAIIQSGSALAAWAQNQPNDAIDYTNALFIKVARVTRSCNNTKTSSPSISDKLRCLRSADVKSLVRFFDQLPSELVPVIDGDFIPGDPADLLTSGRFYRVPLLIGFNREEGAEYYLDSKEARRMFESDRNLTLNDYNKLVEIGYKLAAFEETVDRQLLAELRQHYMPAKLNRETIIDAAMQVAGDYPLTCPTYVYANYTASYNVPVFAYHFTQRVVSGDEDDNPSWMGAYHAIDLGFVFGLPFAPDGSEDGYTEDDEFLSQTVMQYWGNFIKTGNPGQVSVRFSSCDDDDDDNSPGLPLTWPPFSGDSNSCRGRIMELNAKTQVYTCRKAVSCQFKANDCSFWQDHFMYEGEEDVDD